MKSFILTCVMSLTSIFAFGYSYNKLWERVEKYEDDGKPKSAYAVAEQIYKKAAAGRHAGQLLSARLKMASLRQEWAPDSFYTDILELEALRTAEKRPEAKAIYASLLAELYETNRDRAQAEDMELTSAARDIREWTKEQYDSAASENWRLSMQDLPTLSSARSKDWLPFIEQQEQSVYFKHDLLHVLYHRAMEQDEDIWKGTTKTKAALAAAVTEEYKRLGNREAALLTSLDNVQEQEEEKRSGLLEALIKDYGDLPLCAEAYAQLIHCTSGNEQKAELAQECIKRYPQYERIGVVKNILNDLIKPYISWSGRAIYYPGKTYDWIVYSKNAKNVRLEVLRMPDKFDTNALPRKDAEKVAKVRQLGTSVATYTQELQNSNPLEAHRDTIQWKAFDIGRYAMIITGEATEKDAKEKEVVVYSDFICSRLQPLYQNGMGQQRTIVVDGETGQPIEHAQVEFYYLKKTRRENRTSVEEHIHVATLTTDAEGRAALDEDSIPHVPEAHTLYRNVTLGNDIYLSGYNNYVPFNNPPIEQSANPNITLRLYSDRSLYRPGQVVHIGGIMFQKTHWDARVVDEGQVTLVLRDTNGKTLAEQTVETDEMGKISADFVLPQGGLPGTYSIRAEHSYKDSHGYASIAIKVEEYKRPTFEVVMDEAPDMHWPSDTITLTGKAISYHGVPIRDGRVTGYYRFRHPYWYSNDHSERIPCDTLSTDEDGCFAVRVPLKDVQDEALWRGLVLELHVEVLSVAGETHEGSSTVPLCKKPLRLSLSVPEQQDRDRLKPITMCLYSSTSQPTDGTVEWAIYTANQEKRTSNDAVLSGVLESRDKALNFDINTLRDLPPGQYEFYAKATAGAVCDSTSAYFLIFGMEDTQLPKVTPSWIYCPDMTFDKERPACIQVGTSFEDVAIYCSLVAGDEVVEEYLLPLSDELRLIEIPYEERYGDGATFHYIFLKNGKVYQGSQVLRLTQPERTLQWEWKTFRDHLHPGDTETWTLQLRTPDGKPATAQVMATIYDASLDALQPHEWSMFISRAYNISSLPWHVNQYFYDYASYKELRFPMKVYERGALDFDDFNSEWYDDLSFSYGRYDSRAMLELGATAVPMMVKRMGQNIEEGAIETSADGIDSSAQGAEDDQDTEHQTTLSEAPSSLRQNFNETAAFLPRLMTNAQGEVAIRFTLPESLTTWRLLGLAHTEDMMSTTFKGEAVARKDVMARLFLPRFLHVDDKASIRATVQNMTDRDIKGKALLEIYDPETERVIASKRQAFTTKANGECLLTFDYHPDDACPVVAVRLTAESGSFSDGEQYYLPILPNSTYVTESVEIRADSLGTFTTDLSPLFNHDSPTATNRKLTIEYTTHPIWYALQALPSLREPAHDDIISIGSALQAQALSAYIANTTPRLKSLVEIWQREQAQGQPALASRLSEDEELKQIILDETPWLREAESEADRKACLMQLLDANQQENTLYALAQRMEKRLESDGGYSWFPGMRSSEVMTLVVATELARLRVMTHNFSTLPSTVQAILNRLLSRNVTFIAQKMSQDVSDMQKREKEGEKISTAYLSYLEYVYLTQHAEVRLNKAQQADVDYLLDHMRGGVSDMSNWERAIAAVVMKGDGRTTEARKYYESLLEHSTTTDDGTFFDYAGGSFRPTSHKIIHHIAAMEAVHVMEPTNKRLQRGLRRWLLRQKRTQMWESNICTSDAIYALLLDNTAELQAAQPDDIVIQYAKRQVAVSRRDADDAVSGLGFIKKQFADGEAPKCVTIERHTDTEAWGAAYATYLTPMTDASATSTGLTVRRDVSNVMPKVGERIVTRYVITADRDYEYVCLQAGRAACAEPASQYSGYMWSNGLGFYRAVRDSRTEYFFDALPKGTYILEEAAFIDRAGTYSSGLTSIRCLYAPEYGGNTQALEFHVTE